MLIGLTGLATSGKSEVASRLQRRHGFDRLAFADPLKAMLEVLYDRLGIPALRADQMLHGVGKGKAEAMLGHHSSRYAMQTIGTEWGRNTLHPDLWVWCAAESLRLHEGGPVVFDDVRMPNEAAFIRSRGGVVVEVRRPNLKRMNHQSEEGVEADLLLDNNDTLSILLDKTDKLVESLK